MSERERVDGTLGERLARAFRTNEVDATLDDQEVTEVAEYVGELIPPEGYEGDEDGQG